VAEQPRWDLVDLEDGRTWEVRSVDRRRTFGTIGVNEFGYTVHDRAGKRYGPFTTLDDAAYALTAWEEHGDSLLIGAPAGVDAPEGGSGSAVPEKEAPSVRVPAIGAVAVADRRELAVIVAAGGTLLGVLVALTVAAVVVRSRRG
jgi:hypothetical protein